MSTKKFRAADWVDRLALAICRLNEAHKPYLQQYLRQTARTNVVNLWQDAGHSNFPLSELQGLYLRACHARTSTDQEYYAPLCTALDPARHILRAHPTLERVVSPLIGRDEFWVEMLSSGSLTSLTNMLAGVMARASELCGKPYHAAVRELGALLAPAGEEGSSDDLRELTLGYDALLFYGLTLKDSVDIADGVAMLPFESARAFIDDSVVRELAPPGALVHEWESMGVLVRRFRWRPRFRRNGYEGRRMVTNPNPYFRQVAMFLELLAVSHAAPILRLASCPDCINRSVYRLLGLGDRTSGYSQGRSAKEFNAWSTCPTLSLRSFAEAREAFVESNAERLRSMAPVIAWLNEALEGRGPYALETRFVHVAKALERMYDVPDRGISRELQHRVPGYLATDETSRHELKQDVKAFYAERSASVHNRKKHASTQKSREAFEKGFDIARRTLFKQLRDGPPKR